MVQALASFNENAPPRIVFGRAPLIRRLATRASTLTGVPMGTLIREDSRRQSSWARFAVILVARENGKTLTQIGTALGFRDHTSVLHGARRAAQLEGTDTGFAELVGLLRAEAGR